MARDCRKNITSRDNKQFSMPLAAIDKQKQESGSWSVRGDTCPNSSISFKTEVSADDWIKTIVRLITVFVVLTLSQEIIFWVSFAVFISFFVTNVAHAFPKFSHIKPLCSMIKKTKASEVTKYIMPRSHFLTWNINLLNFEWLSASRPPLPNSPGAKRRSRKGSKL